MTSNELTTALAQMKIRKNNTLTVGNFKITKWGADYFHLETTEGKYIGVAGQKWLTGKLINAGAVKG